MSGITSFCAVAARLNMGLAEMAEPLHVIPATYKAEEMDELLKLPGTKVLMKSGKRLKKVRDSILRSGQNAVCLLYTSPGMNRRFRFIRRQRSEPEK